MLVTIDPGLKTGVAVWSENGLLLANYELSTKKSRYKDYSDIFRLGEKLEDILKRITQKEMLGHTAIIEQVQYWGGSLVSDAAIRSGNLFKLSSLIGIYTYLFHKYHFEVELIKAVKWKGQLPDAAVRSRVIRILPKCDKIKSQHTIDAIGLGLYKTRRM